ncbi:hypothetical protein D5396_09735 [Rahnella inusitata]|uniref:Uncharacterized protein n=1 Tax=Rahnella inusitata TaxID=58169 RepID=A0ABX9P2E6_9GAMM|nr:hypothetical protein D5396_09735 [Rahnella inusitata]
MRWPRSLTRIPYSGKLIGISSLAAFPHHEIFRDNNIIICISSGVLSTLRSYSGALWSFTPFILLTKLHGDSNGHFIHLNRQHDTNHEYSFNK